MITQEDIDEYLDDRRKLDNYPRLVEFVQACASMVPDKWVIIESISLLKECGEEVPEWKG